MTASAPRRFFGVSGRFRLSGSALAASAIALAGLVATASVLVLPFLSGVPPLSGPTGTVAMAWSAPPSSGGAPTPSASAKPESVGLVFGIINVHSSERSRAMWEPILDDLSRALGRPVSLRLFGDYAGVVWALGSGDIDLGWMGNKAAIHAVDTAGAEIFAQKLGRNGEAGYRSYLIAGPTTEVADFAAVLAVAKTNRRDDGGRRPRLALGDPNSTSGTLIPTYHLFRPSGIGLNGLFRAVTRGGHEENFMAVASGAADVGTISSTAFDSMCVVEPLACARLRVIWRSPPIPGDPLLWRRGLKAETRAGIRGFFLRYGEHAGAEGGASARENLARLGASSFRASDNEQLIPVREIEDYQAATPP